MPRFPRIAPTALAALALAAAFAPAGLEAQRQPATTLSSDRPGLGDGAWVVAPGVFQVEVGGAALLRDASGFAVGQGLVRYGFADFELRVYPNSYVFGDAGEGLQDLGIGVKVPLTWGQEAVALVAGGTLPTGSNRAGGDVITLFGTGVWEGSLNEQVALAVNAGVAFPGDDPGDGILSFVVTPSMAVGSVEGLSAYAGVAAYAGPIDQFFLEAGLARVVDPDTQIDLNAGWDLDSGDAFIGVGFARRWR